MCLIIDRPEATPIDDSLISRAMSNNAHGWGIMSADNGTIRTVKGFGEESFRHAYGQLGERACVIHYRLATHGEKSLDNCHPFSFGGGKYALMHNGIIDVAPDHNAKRSDTWHFTHDVVEPMLTSNPNLFGTDRLDNVLSRLIGSGNKLVILRADGAKMRVHECEGTDHEGLWLSNTWSLPRPSSVASVLSRASVWDKYDRDYTTARSSATRYSDPRDEYMSEELVEIIEEEEERDAFTLDSARHLWDLEGLTERDIRRLCYADPDRMAELVSEAIA